jgi:hypothetical protein
MSREICTLADVKKLVPGYGDDSDDVLNALIPAESVTAHRDTGREFVTIAGLTTRLFDITDRHVAKRVVPVGDMTTVTTVTLKDLNGTSLGTTTSFVRLGADGNRNRQEWEPVTHLWFPEGMDSPAALAKDTVLEVVGVWGFPDLPEDLVMAVAKMVLVRYLSDAASAGSSLADALNEQGFNAGTAFASAQDTFDSYRLTEFAS